MKFSIRDLFLVTVIVAILLTWWLDRSRIREEVRRITIENEVAKENLADTQALLLKPEVQEALVKSMAKAYSVPLTSQGPAPNPPKP